MPRKSNPLVAGLWAAVVAVLAVVVLTTQSARATFPTQFADGSCAMTLRHDVQPTTLTYSVNVCRWSRSRNQLTQALTMTVGATVSGSGALALTGIQSRAKNTSGLIQRFPVFVSGVAVTPSYVIYGEIQPGETSMSLYAQAENGAPVAVSDLSAGDKFSFTLTEIAEYP